MDLFLKANFRIQIFILIFNIFIWIPHLFLFLPSFAAEVTLPFHFVDGDGVLPLKVVFFEAGKWESAFTLGTNIIVFGYLLFNFFLFEVGLAAVSKGRLLWDFFSEGTRVLLPLSLKELKSRDLPALLFKVALLFFRTTCFTK
jgi:hypothetical protein